MADITLNTGNMPQIIDDMTNASKSINQEIENLTQSLAPFASQFRGQAASAYQDFQQRVKQLESQLQVALQQGSIILENMVQGHVQSDVRASQAF